MQKAISNKIQLRQTLNPLKDYAGVPSINDEGTLENFRKLRQAQIASELPRKSYASVTYSDKKQLEFVLDLTTNTESNYSSMEICLPLQFYSKTKTKLVSIMTVNNFFWHWFTDIGVKRYPDDKRILLTNNSLGIYQYSYAQLKYLPEKSVKTQLKTMLYTNKPIYLDADVDRRQTITTTIISVQIQI